MPLTPEDVRNKQFTTVRLREGYDEDEVDAFLDEVEAELTRLYKESADLRAQLATAQTRPQSKSAPPVPAAPAREAAPVQAAASAGDGADAATRILQLAQRTADEAVSEARSKSDRIINEARGQADKMLSEARSRSETMDREGRERQQAMVGSLEQQRVDLERQVENLRAFEREYRTRLKSYLESQLRDLDVRGDDIGPRATNSRQPATAGVGQGGGRFLEDEH
ncbi:MAG TPA: DivIVA domain-containing protein [Actinomycetes bacterium]|jgi:DivIVA domain-containing protein|nr:DivIVA domain-containing protein [Actinomycetes bacterium]